MSSTGSFFFFLNLECMLKSRWHLCCIVTGDTTHSAVLIPISTEETPCIFINPHLSNVNVNLTMLSAVPDTVSSWNWHVTLWCFMLVFHKLIGMHNNNLDQKVLKYVITETSHPPQFSVFIGLCVLNQL
jgi:hypothetical protein